MKQRIAIARTLLHDPQVLVLDEPANGLDPQARIDMRDLLLQLASAGKTLIVTSHILPELARICDTVAIITHGKLRAFGSQADIIRQISHRRTFEVQLADRDQLSAAAESTRAFFGADTKTEVSHSETESVIRFDAELSDLELASLLSKLVDQEILVAQFREIPTDLEDAFLSVTSGNAPDSVATKLAEPAKAKVSE